MRYSSDAARARAGSRYELANSRAASSGTPALPAVSARRTQRPPRISRAPSHGAAFTHMYQKRQNVSASRGSKLRNGWATFSISSRSKRSGRRMAASWADPTAPVVRRHCTRSSSRASSSAKRSSAICSFA